MKVEPSGGRSDGLGEVDATPEHESDLLARRKKGPSSWLESTNHSPGLIGLIKRARRALPGDPHFGDRLSTTGFGGPEAAARAAERLLGDRDAASREMGYAALQVWQALSEGVGRRPANTEVTLVFTDLVGFSGWALDVGDDATLKLLRRVAQAIEPPLLAAGGQVVKRMGDGLMAVFGDPVTAIGAVLEARRALKSVEVEGHTPVMRAGIHTGRPQKIGSDWLGVDVNIAARVMEGATKGGLLVSGSALEKISPDDLRELGVTAKRMRKPVFAHKPSGVPADITIYRLQTRRQLPAAATPNRGQPSA